MLKCPYFGAGFGHVTRFVLCERPRFGGASFGRGEGFVLCKQHWPWPYSYFRPGASFAWLWPPCSFLSISNFEVRRNSFFSRGGFEQYSRVHRRDVQDSPGLFWCRLIRSSRGACTDFPHWPISAAYPHRGQSAASHATQFRAIAHVPPISVAPAPEPLLASCNCAVRFAQAGLRWMGTARRPPSWRARFGLDWPNWPGGLF